MYLQLQPGTTFIIQNFIFINFIFIESLIKWFCFNAEKIWKLNKIDIITNCSINFWQFNFNSYSFFLLLFLFLRICSGFIPYFSGFCWFLYLRCFLSKIIPQSKKVLFEGLLKYLFQFISIGKLTHISIHISIHKYTILEPNY